MPFNEKILKIDERVLLNLHDLGSGTILDIAYRIKEQKQKVRESISKLEKLGMLRGEYFHIDSKRWERRFFISGEGTFDFIKHLKKRSIGNKTVESSRSTGITKCDTCGKAIIIHTITYYDNEIVMESSCEECDIDYRIIWKPTERDMIRKGNIHFTKIYCPKCGTAMHWIEDTTFWICPECNYPLN